MNIYGCQDSPSLSASTLENAVATRSHFHVDFELPSVILIGTEMMVQDEISGAADMISQGSIPRVEGCQILRRWSREYRQG